MSYEIGDKLTGSSIYAVEINGKHTDIVINKYSNCYFIVITQVGKLGTIVSIARDPIKTEVEAKDIFSTRVLFGCDSEEIHVAARFLIERLKLDNSAVFAFGIKDLNVSVIKAIGDFIATKLQ